MKSSFDTPARSYAKGIGDAVADRTVNRLKMDGSRETWADVAFRVSLGNALLEPREAHRQSEFEAMHHHLRQASVLMSGRHLQHGDEDQPNRNQEVFTNCSTSASSFILFYLLLNGSGVGRAYDDDMMVVDWSANLPLVLPVIRDDHPDVLTGEIDKSFTIGALDAELKFRKVHRFTVPDSREGWAKAVEKIEHMTWTGNHSGEVLLLDFSDVRHRGQPIGGMQDRPASGPGPLMLAIKNIADLKGNGMEPWVSTLHADHYLAECVLVGGARRAARMSTKTWRDKSVLDFVTVKKGGSVLWSSNNSVTVDEEFWKLVRAGEHDLVHESIQTSALAQHAKAVYEAICHSSYFDQTGEPGIINADKLVQKDDGVEALFDGNYAESDRFKLDPETHAMTAQLASIFARKRHKMITNPCGEISLSMLGGYCVIADVVPYHAGGNAVVGEDRYDDKTWDNDAESAFRTATRALIRTNTMNCLYGKEVQRTNRIGVGFTGIFEYAWTRFGFGFRDLLNEELAQPFWQAMARFSNAVVDEAVRYSQELGVAIPHTALTVKPAGTTSKLFGLTEGAHLASMREYLRWVQFRSDDPLIDQYRAKGYPVRDKLKTYEGTSIVGFPTAPEICQLGMGDKLVTAAEATPEEQYQWLRLLEKYWLRGHRQFDVSGAVGWLEHTLDNQVSYTLKYDPKVVDYETFKRTLLAGQSTIKACSVMPQTDATAYEYQPEEPVSAERFQEILKAISDDDVEQDIGLEHMACAGGACPIDFRAEKVS